MELENKNMKHGLPFNTQDLIKRGNILGQRVASKFPSLVKPFKPVGSVSTTTTPVIPSAPVQPPVTVPQVAPPVTQPSLIPKTEGGRDALEAKLIDALARSKPGKSLEEQRGELATERGLPEKREQLGTFEQEIDKTFNLLDDLKENIKTRTGQFLVSEPQRARIEASERAPLLKTLERGLRGKEIIERGITREVEDINTILNFREVDRTRELDTLVTELDLRSKIKDLTEETLDEKQKLVMNAVIDLAIKYPQAGVTEEDTLQEANTKVAPFAKDEDIKTERIDRGDRIDLINSQTGKVIKSFSKGSTPAEAIKAKEKADEAEEEEILQQGLVLSAIDKVEKIESIINHPDLSSVVGPFGITRLKLKSRFGGAADVLASVNQLLSKETIDTLVDLKSRGGTLGALSDQERIMLRNAASKLGSFEIVDKTGRTIGYKASEESFKRELNILLMLSRRAVQRARGETITKTGITAIDTPEALGSSGVTKSGIKYDILE